MDEATATRIYDKLDEIKNDSNKRTDEIKVDITKILVDMAKMPCDSHNEKFKDIVKDIDTQYKHLSLMLKTHWAITLLMLSGLVTVAYKSFV